MDTEQHILCLAARTRLTPEARDALVGRLRDRVDWPRLWSQAQLHDVLPLVTATLRDLRGRGPVPTKWLARGERRLFSTLLRNRALAEELRQVVVSLRDVGVDAMPVKGIVLAQAVYGSLALRPAADIDVLVRPGDLPEARRTLRARGYGHRGRLLFEEAHHPYHDPQYFRRTAAGDLCLELHHGLWDRRFFGAEHGLWDRAHQLDLGGTQVSVLAPEDALLHLAIHRTRSPLRLRLVCDVAEVVRAQGPALDWDALRSRAERLGARTALHAALDTAAELLDAPVPVEVRRALRPNAVKRRVVRRTCGRRAVFRPAADDDLAQQPSLALRVFEQDGVLRMSRTLARGVGRKRAKRAWARAQRALSMPPPEGVAPTMEGG